MQLKPKLRFTQFKDDWKKIPLSNVCHIVGGGTPNTNELINWNGNINWFTPSEIGKTRFVSESQRKITKFGLYNSSAKLLPIGTILFTSRATIGEMSILENESTTNQGFQSLIVNKNYDRDFVYFLQNKIKEYAFSKAIGSTFLEISKTNLSKFETYYPTLPEQTRITTMLNLHYKKCQLQKEKVELLQRQKQAIVAKYFANKNYGDVMIFSDILEEYTIRNTNLYKPVAVGKYGIRLREDIYSKELSTNIVNNKVITKDTLTIGMGTTQIDIGILWQDISYSVSPAYHTFRISNNTDAYFLNEYMKYSNKLLSNLYMVTGARQGKSINKEAFLRHSIHLPNTSEQLKKRKFWELLDKKLTLESQKFTLLQKYKQGLLQKMFV